MYVLKCGYLWGVVDCVVELLLRELCIMFLYVAYINWNVAYCFAMYLVRHIKHFEDTVSFIMELIISYSRIEASNLKVEVVWRKFLDLIVSYTLVTL